MNALPAWFRGPDASSDQTPGWPTDVIRVDGVRCSLGVPSGWTGPVEHDQPDGALARWDGTVEAEILEVERARRTDDHDDPRRWIDVLIELVGVPFVLQPNVVNTELLSREDVDDDTGAALARVLDATTSHASSGLAIVETDERFLVRWYVVVAGRDDDVWKTTLVLPTACLPGTAADVVDRNDHARSRPTFASLALA